LTPGPARAEPLGLPGAGPEHLGQQVGRGRPRRGLGQLRERHGGDLDVQVDAVQQRAGDLAQVLLDLRRRAAAGPPRIGAVSAGARVHRRHQDEVGREGRGPQRPADRHAAVLQGLAQHLQRLAVELRQLVEEQDALVRQADLAGLRDAAAADQPGVADGVVRRAERPHRHQRLPGPQESP
jgi:hypothetical protein